MRTSLLLSLTCLLLTSTALAAPPTTRSVSRDTLLEAEKRLFSRAKKLGFRGLAYVSHQGFTCRGGRHRSTVPRDITWKVTKGKGVLGVSSHNRGTVDELPHSTRLRLDGYTLTRISVSHARDAKNRYMEGFVITRHRQQRVGNEILHTTQVRRDNKTETRRWVQQSDLAKKAKLSSTAQAIADQLRPADLYTRQR